MQSSFESISKQAQELAIKGGLPTFFADAMLKKIRNPDLHDFAAPLMQQGKLWAVITAPIAVNPALYASKPNFIVVEKSKSGCYRCRTWITIQQGKKTEGTFRDSEKSTQLVDMTHWTGVHDYYEGANYEYVNMATDIGDVDMLLVLPKVHNADAKRIFLDSQAVWALPLLAPSVVDVTVPCLHVSSSADYKLDGDDISHSACVQFVPRDNSVKSWMQRWARHLYCAYHRAVGTPERRMTFGQAFAFCIYHRSTLNPIMMGYYDGVRYHHKHDA